MGDVEGVEEWDTDGPGDRGDLESYTRTAKVGENFGRLCAYLQVYALMENVKVQKYGKIYKIRNKLIKKQIII